MVKSLFASLLLLLQVAAPTFADDSREKVVEELKKQFPLSEWKTIGFVGYKREPLMEMRVPKFLNWEPDCNLHSRKRGIEYCGPNTSPPVLSGKVSIRGVERFLEVNMEGFIAERDPSLRIRPTIGWVFRPWEEVGALLSKEEISLSGEPALMARMEDLSGKHTPFQIKVQTLIKFQYPFFGGMLYFIETESDGTTHRFVPHKDQVFRWVIDEVIKSFQFKVKVGKWEDVKVKAPPKSKVLRWDDIKGRGASPKSQDSKSP